MPLPTISNFILGTRQPLDITGAAIEAWRATSSEARMTRQQNLAEVEAGRDAGQQAHDNQLKAVQLQDDLLNSEVNREVAMGNLEMRAMEHKFRMEEAQWERQNLLPLEIDHKRALIDSAQTLADSRRYAIQADRDELAQFRGEANDIGRALQIVQAGPQEGEEVDVHLNRIRDLNALINARKAAWSDSKNSAISSFFSTTEARLQKQPLWQYLHTQGDLATEGEKAAIRAQRERAIALLPFPSDQERNGWKSANAETLDSLMATTDDYFGKWWSQTFSELQSANRKRPEGSTYNAFQDSAQQDRDLLLRRNAAAAAGRNFILSEDGKTQIPFEVLDRNLRGLGFTDDDLISAPSAEAGQGDAADSYIDNVLR